MRVVWAIQTYVEITNNVDRYLVRDETIKYNGQFVKERLLDCLRARAVHDRHDRLERTSSDTTRTQTISNVVGCKTSTGDKAMLEAPITKILPG